MTDTRLDGRSAIVTGGARGIGLAAGAALARAGARVLLADVDVRVAEQEAVRLASDGLTVAACRVDIADAESTRGMVAKALDTFGGVDILVNNAAVPDTTPFEALTPDHWDRILSVNLTGAYRCTAAALPSLERSEAASVVHVASIQGVSGQRDALAYATAKGGLVSMTRCMAVDFGARGIRVNAVAPGFVDTRMALLPEGGREYETDWFQDVFIKHGRLPLRRPGTPQDVAGPIVFLASDESRYVTGHVLVVDGGVLCTY